MAWLEKSEPGWHWHSWRKRGIKTPIWEGEIVARMKGSPLGYVYLGKLQQDGERDKLFALLVFQLVCTAPELLGALMQVMEAVDPDGKSAETWAVEARAAIEKAHTIDDILLTDEEAA